MFLVFRKYSLITLLMIFAILLSSASSDTERYKVIKVIDGDTVYLDFNKDGIPQQEDTPFQHIRKRFHRNGFASTTETGSQVSKTLDCSLCQKVRVKGIDTFEVKPDDHLRKQMNLYNLKQKEVLGLGYKAKEFSKKTLLNKKVNVEIFNDDSFGRKLVYIDINDKDYGEMLLNAGLAVVYYPDTRHPNFSKYSQLENMEKVRQNGINAGKLNLYVYNSERNIYHQPICQFAQKCKVNCELMEFKDIPKNAKSCRFFDYYKTLYQDETPEEIHPDAQSKGIELYFIDSTKYVRPSDRCRTSACQSLLREIKNANEIEFAIYGISSQPEIFNALLEAKRQGKIVRGVTDMDTRNRNIYPDTQYLIYKLGDIQTDYFDKEIYKGSKNFDIQGAIMHDKFFIFDKKKVWTGSTNISSSGTGGYNTNISVLINSPKVAKLYLKEFNQMYYYRKFHKDKDEVKNTTNIKVGDSIVSVYFLPRNNAFDLDIIPKIKNAKEYIYLPMFFLTNWKVCYALIDAKNRGVDVRVILDGISAANPRSFHHYLRKRGIPVKVENWGGKMHSKTAIIDDEYTVVASMNWTKNGEKVNDENVVVIKNQYLTQKTKEFFLHQWDLIPEKYLTQDPKAEGEDSPYSCFDGIDNDHNGFTDFDDPKCKYLFEEH